MNLKFTIVYDGSKFSGSQKQPNGLGVENELLKVFKVLKIDSKITFSGRTDSGVHATGQVFNATFPKHFSDLEKLKEIFNRRLSGEVRVKDIKRVEKSFNSRFSAKKRVYRYFISTSQLTPFNYNYLSYKKDINEEKIRSAINEFVGIHDFEYFHKLGSDKKNFIKEVYEAKFYRYKDYYVFKFKANSYLRTQIRLMVGFLLAISDGKVSLDDLRTQLQKREKIYTKPALGNGLYLSKVIY